MDERLQNETVTRSESEQQAEQSPDSRAVIKLRESIPESLSQWVTLQVRADGLPSEPFSVFRMLFRTQFKIAIHSADGDRYILPFASDGEARHIFHAVTLVNSKISVVTTRFGFMHDPLVDPVPLPFPQILSARAEVVPGRERNSAVGGGAAGVRLYVRADYFDPDGQSGADATLEGSVRVTPGELVPGTLHLAAGDSTDHLRLETNEEHCAGLLLVHGGALVDAQFHRSSGNRWALRPLTECKQDLRLFHIACDAQHPGILRLRASLSPRQLGYWVYLSRSASKLPDRERLLHAWAQSSPFSSDDIFPQLYVSDDSRCAASGVDVIRSVTRADFAEMAVTIDSMLTRDGNAAPFIASLEQHFEQYEDALRSCCESSERMHLILNAIRLKRGIATDRDGLRRSLASIRMSTNLRMAIERAIGEQK